MAPDFTQEDPEFESNEERVWVWKNWIPHHQVTIIAGDSAIGKSRTLASVLGCLVRQEPFPDGEFPDMQAPHILLINTESDKLEVSDTYKAQGWDETDFRHLHILRQVQHNGLLESFDIDKPHHLEALAKERKKYKEVIIVLDPFVEFHSRNTISDSQIRALVVKLQLLARSWKVSIILMAHWNKNEKQSYGARLAGSHQLTAGVRAMINLYREKNLRVFHQHKNTNGPEQPDITYTIEAPAGSVMWNLQTVASPDTKIGQAEIWLKKYLTDHGEVSIKDCIEACDYTELTLRRARHNLDLEIFTRWKLPEGGHKQIAYWELRSEKNLWGLIKLKTSKADLG